jgi:hypothetical protein
LNEQSSILVEFATNDPSAPALKVTIVYTPTAKLYCVPQTLIFGNLQPSQSAVASVDVYADGREEKFAWDRLTCEPADRFAIRFAPAPPAESETLNGSIAAKIGTLHVTLRAPDAPGPIADAMILKADAKEVYRIPVSARCVPEFELSPATVFLPRRSASGPVYTSSVVCLSTAGREFRLRASPQAPPGLEIKVDEDRLAAVHTITITCPDGWAPGRDCFMSAELIASPADGRSAALRLAVRIDPAAGQ